MTKENMGNLVINMLQAFDTVHSLSLTKLAGSPHKKLWKALELSLELTLDMFDCLLL